MKKKTVKALSLLLSAWFVFASASCGGEKPQPTEPSEPTYEYVSLLSDKKFENGFTVRGLGAPIYGDEIENYPPKYDTDVVFQYDKQDTEKPSWNLAQWASRYPFHDVNNTVSEEKNGKTTFNYAFSDLGNGKYRYDNQSKTVEVDTATGEIELSLRASECYKYDRAEGEEWPHLLLEQKFSTGKDAPRQTALKNTDSLVVSLDCKLNSFADKMTGEADKDLHSAVCMLYLFVSYLPKGSVGFSDMMWLGLTVFDNRTPFASGMSGADEGTKGSATGKWIYNVPTTKFFSLDNNLYDDAGNMKFGEWATLEIDMYEYVKSALSDAQRGGMMKGATMKDLYISGTYLGFETPGTYDLDMSFRNFDIETYIKQ